MNHQMLKRGILSVGLIGFGGTTHAQCRNVDVQDHASNLGISAFTLDA